MKRFERLLSLVFLAASLWVPASQAATLHVPAGYSAIQDAIDAAVDGDTVIVAPGTYVENINFLGKAITVESSDGAEQTVIDGGNPPDPDFGSVVTFSSGEGADSLLQGFTITNGKGTYFFHGLWTWCGGGILCSSSSPTIMNNTISENSTAEGGGIFCSSSSPTIMNNTISKNNALGGGGIFCASSSPTIMNNTISEQSVGGGISCEGFSSSPTITNNTISENHNYGGISCFDDASPSITNNVITGNTAIVGHHAAGGGGIGIYCHNPSSSIIITNNIISENITSTGAGGIYCTHFKNVASLTITNNTITGNICCGAGGIQCLNASTTITNTIVWGNESGYGYSQIDGNPTVTYSNVQGGFPGIGNIDSDPLFVDPANSDYHLTFNSPCRGSGNSAAPGLPDTDFEGDPRIAYGTVDMGADEFYTHLYFTGDTTPGGTVEVKLTGLPGTGPVFLCVGSGVLDVPISTQYGYWRLDFPLLLMLGMGSMASPEGVSVLPFTFDPRFPAMDIPIQALIGMELTNFCVMSVK